MLRSQIRKKKKKIKNKRRRLNWLTLKLEITSLFVTSKHGGDHTISNHGQQVSSSSQHECRSVRFCSVKSSKVSFASLKKCIIAVPKTTPPANWAPKTKNPSFHFKKVKHHQQKCPQIWESSTISSPISMALTEG